MSLRTEINCQVKARWTFNDSRIIVMYTFGFHSLGGGGCHPHSFNAPQSPRQPLLSLSAPPEYGFDGSGCYYLGNMAESLEQKSSNDCSSYELGFSSLLFILRKILEMPNMYKWSPGSALKSCMNIQLASKHSDIITSYCHEWLRLVELLADQHTSAPRARLRSLHSKLRLRRFQ